ncbi:MAG: PEP-CTERM sorting domain-containing protein, partial [Janthinobacterium lividum]
IDQQNTQPHTGPVNTYLQVTRLNGVTGGPTPLRSPEPSSIALLGTGSLGVIGMMKRRFA